MMVNDSSSAYDHKEERVRIAFENHSTVETWNTPYPDIPAGQDIRDIIRLASGTLLAYVNSAGPMQLMKISLLDPS